jgi:hypothetical protein
VPAADPKTEAGGRSFRISQLFGVRHPVKPDMNALFGKPDCEPIDKFFILM